MEARPTLSRLQRLRDKLETEKLNGVLVTADQNRLYMTGFTGSSGWVLVTPSENQVATDGRYWSQFKKQCPDWELVKFSREDHKDLGEALWSGRTFEKGFRMGFNGGDLSYSAYQQLRSGLPEEVELVPVKGLVEGLRECKESTEVEELREAAAIADRALASALKHFKEGVAERDFATELEHQLKIEGARGTSFDTIVASGPNGALPHAGATSRKIRAGELVTLDFGAQCERYVSDMTRTIWIGKLPELETKVRTAVWEAQRAALETVRAGIPIAEVCEAARAVLRGHQMEEYFLHSLGHGIGLAVHENPGMRKQSEGKLEPGQAITVEPGVYIEGKTGCRIEDSVVVTEAGCDFLTRSPYQQPGQEHPLEAYEGLSSTS